MRELAKKQPHVNELFEEIRKTEKPNNKGKITYSKPTFTNHLNHLITDGFIIKKKDETDKKGQKLILSLNYEKIGNSREYVERTERIIKNFKKNENEFYSWSEDKQIDKLLSFIIRKKLSKIQAQIDYRLNPESFDKWFALQFWDSVFLELPEEWMIDKCIKDEVYRNKILEIIVKFLEE
jgi:DNA-binding MarR family transcriptional regulator